MYIFTTDSQEDNLENSETEQDDSLQSSEAMQGDKALISTINELNDLRAEKTG